jgi:chromosome segregation ATPase
MSKAAKQSIIILGLLLLISIGYAFYSMMETQKAKDENLQLNQKLTQVQDRESKAKGEVKNLKDELSKVNSEKDRLDEKVKKAEKTAEDLYGQITEISQERDKWKTQIDSIGKERDDLVTKIKDLQDQLTKKEETLAKPAVPVSPASPQASGPSSDMAMSQQPPAPNGNEDYWASVLRDKASLEVKIEQLNQDLSQKNAELIDIKQANADFKVRLEGLQHDKDDVEREIKYKSDMVNNLSLELARTKNDKKYVADSINKLNDENANLRQQVKQLVATKGSLEKSILRLTQDRDSMQRKLGQTETLVQSKIDEIWNIKDSLDQSMKDAKADMPKQNGVELPPIVVNNDAQAVPFNSGMSTPGMNGKVVNLNKENNFVVVDIGESQGIKVGNVLNVYRGNKYIARLEVIQVRKDISAADIKDQWTDISIGDQVR